MSFSSWENQKILVQFNFGLSKLTRGRVWQLENRRLDSGLIILLPSPVPDDASGDSWQCMGTLSLLVQAIIHSWNVSAKTPSPPLPLDTGECTGDIKGKLLVFGCGSL